MMRTVGRLHQAILREVHRNEMGDAELLIAGLLVAVVGLSALARWMSVPYPVVLVIGGAVVGFIPGLPEVRLDPQVVLVVFLPPLLYGSAIFANLNDFRSDRRWVTLNAVPLVLVTMLAVACAAHAIVPGMSWSAAFVLGAVVSPTDPLAAAAIMRRLRAPRRLVSAVEGEGLFNDATALVAYRVAVAAVVAGTFSLSGAAVHFVLGAVGGVAIGLLVGWLSAEIRKRTPEARENVTISLLTGYAAFVPAEALGASGVLATVAAGLYLGVGAPRFLEPRTRLQSGFVWDLLDFIVNAVLFVLIGLQLRTVVEALPGTAFSTAVGYALVVAGVVIATRLVWFFTIPYLVWAFEPKQRRQSDDAGAGARFLVAWSGMRGAVSLAVALALPLTTDSGAAFPKRDLIIFITFVVILATLVLQGLSLPTIMRRLGIGDTEEEASEENKARMLAARAALAELDELAAEGWTRQETIERLRRFYRYRKGRFAARAGIIDDEHYEPQTLAYQRTLQRVIEAQRDALLDMRDDGDLAQETMNQLIRELDLEESRLEL
jgi:Na+/H+ antiporter